MEERRTKTEAEVGRTDEGYERLGRAKARIDDLIIDASTGQERRRKNQRPNPLPIGEKGGGDRKHKTRENDLTEDKNLG